MVDAPSIAPRDAVRAQASPDALPPDAPQPPGHVPAEASADDPSTSQAAGHADPAKHAVVSAEGLGVRYTLYGLGQRRHRIELVNRLMRQRRYFWALRDVSFQVNANESFFVIGRNGAGKSTLLRVLADTLLPDAGEVRVRGNLTGFLSMGLGFQPDLSGYENIALALTLMKAPRVEHAERIRDIEAFTQLGEFLKAPVATYSAGMKARLGFAIATTLEPDILIMDEIINAGDEQFREAARTRLQAMTAKARGVIVCTHNLPQVLELAQRVMWIEGGRVQAIGDPAEVVREYRQFAKAVKADPTHDLRVQQERIEDP
ncbi:MAG: ABC transporter ATP-binding protein [Planctomycetota bacterium]